MNKNYKLGDFYLDAASRNLLYQNKLIRLSPRAFEILLLLIKNRGEVVGKNEIVETVWADSFVEENNLAVHISALRRVLKENDSDTKYIETVTGRGYRLLVPVEELQSGVFARLTADLAAQPDAPRSIAILPFANKSNDSKLDYLAEGITQSLITNLSPLAQSKVIAYNAVAHYKARETDLREVGFLLGVEAILVGHIFESDGTLEIGVELIKVNDLSHLWGTQYQCRFEQLLKTRTEISIAIAEKLQLKLTNSQLDQLAKQPTESSDAYKLYLKGLNFTEKRTKEAFLKGIYYFNKALKIDSEFAPAYAGIAEAYINLGHYSLIPAAETILKTRAAVQKALTLNKNLSEAHSVNGLLHLYTSDLKNAEKSLRQAVQLNPNSSIAYGYYSIYLLAVENFQSSLFNQRKAIELNPFVSSRISGLTTRFCLMRKYSEAIKSAEEVCEIFPNNYHSYSSLAYAYTHLGEINLALKNIQISYEIAPPPRLTL